MRGRGACCQKKTILAKIVDIVLIAFVNSIYWRERAVSVVETYMTHESTRRLNYEPETPLVDSHIKFAKPRRGLVTRASETFDEMGTLALLVILAAEESIKHRRADAYIEQLREYDDWVD